MKHIDLNVDLGEGGANDAELLEWAGSANIACGGHAGDAETMRAAIRLARAGGGDIGAHPGYEDRDGFGRRRMDLPAADVREMVVRQLEGFREIARGEAVAVGHVKPHGALYNQADRSPELAMAVVDAVRTVFPEAAVFGPPGGCLERAARAAGLDFVAEGFADRRYEPDGALVARSEAGAVIADVAEAVAQALEIALRGRVRAVDGSWLPLPAETLCVHGDGPEAAALLRQIREALGAEGFRIGR